jgi:Flp pilus assembly protein TadD
MRRILTTVLALLAVGAGWWIAGRSPSGLPAAVGPETTALFQRGLAELENERFAAAEEAFAELTRRDPGEPTAFADLGLARAQLGRVDEALAALDRAVRMAPDDPGYRRMRADVLEAAGRDREAAADIGHAVLVAPDDPALRFRQLGLADALGDTDGRDHALAALVAQRPENVPVLIEQVRAATTSGDRPEASTVALRLRELYSLEPGPVAGLVDELIDALEAGDAAAARLAAARLANAARGSDLYRLGQRELRGATLSAPVTRLRSSRPRVGFGPPLVLHWRTRPLDDGPGGDLVAADFDGDQRPDLARVLADGRLEIRRAADAWRPGAVDGVRLDPAARLAVVDLDDDGPLDLVAWSPAGTTVLRGDGAGGFRDTTSRWGLGPGAGAVAAIDFDLDGDLDLALFGGGWPAGALLRSNLVDPLAPTRALPALAAGGAIAARVADLDRDGDPDLVVLFPDHLLLLDNLRQGRFADVTARAGLSGAGGGRDLVVADLDGDGWPDLVLGGDDGAIELRNRNGGFEPPRTLATRPCDRLAKLDGDNDGRIDLACAGPGGDALLHAAADGRRSVEELPGSSGVAALAAADLDHDGDLDLASSGPGGAAWEENLDGNRHGWLSVRLAGLARGNGKNNRHGLQSILEVHAGDAVQVVQVDGEPTHVGLGEARRADRLRVVWPNGVPQDRLDVAADQRLVEEQVLKGSCPFLYAWQGDRFEFVTDLLWNGPLGMPLAPGVWATADPGTVVRSEGGAWAKADPEEIVKVDRTVPDHGRYRFVVTEELWEATFLDRIRLWVVDHPEGTEAASTLKVQPGQIVDDRVVVSRDVRPVVQAIDGRGRDVTRRVAERDEIYADGFTRGRFQGAAEPWSIEFDLGAAPARPVRLHLDAWIFPADASLNLAIADRRDLPYLPPRLDMLTASGWRPLVESIGFPAGKTKTMVVDTPALPAGVHRLRIVSSLWLGFDRIAWSDEPDDAAARIVARLAPARAVLGFGGYSALVRTAPNGPHFPDFAHRSPASPWLPFPGRYTRYGDVRELLENTDDRSVILAAGDQLDLDFDAASVPPPAPGFVRTVFLESFGWDKDADRNTWQSAHLGPLPFRAQQGYPDGHGNVFPDDELHRSYVRDWLTRQVPPAGKN